MKITKRELKFDMVLEGEKINSLDELREHPSTELLEMHKDGRLSRWLRIHGGAAEADKLREITLSGDQAQDLFAVCQALGIDLMLEDIDDALKEEENSQQDTESASSGIEENDDTEEDDLEDDSETDDPTVSEWKTQFEIIKQSIDVALIESINGGYSFFNKPIIYTNISLKKEPEHITIKHIDDTEFVGIPDYIHIQPVKAAIFEGKIIGLNFYKSEIDFYLLFVKGENVIINFNGRRLINTCIFAKNIYVSNISLFSNKNMILIGENIFLDSLYSAYLSLNNAYIFAKNVISIGRASLFPPFSKEKLDTWISDKTYSSGTVYKNDKVYLSASQYLYDSQKEGNYLNPLMAKKLFNAVKKSYLNWTSNPSFYSASRRGNSRGGGFLGF